MSRPSLECCRPYSAYTHAGGRAWYHQSKCPENAGHRVGYEPDHEALAEAVAAHPASYERGVIHWNSHPGCSCDLCKYVNAHIDDEDDDRSTGLEVVQ